MAPATSSSSSSSYTPIYQPIQPHRSLKLDPSLSTRKAHFRRLYDIYNVALQRNNLAQARRAYSLLVRCKEFDWAANWRSGLEMVALDPSTLEGEDDVDHQHYGDLTLNEERLRMKERRLLLLKVDYLRECHIIHSRKARKKHSLRESEAILLQIVLLLASANKHAEALNELELYLPVSPYRDNALLHYYAGLLCIYLAQVEVLQEGTTSSTNPGALPGFPMSSQAHSVNPSSTTSGRRARASSASSTTSASSDSSSSSGDDDDHVPSGSHGPFPSSSRHSKSQPDPLHPSSSSQADPQDQAKKRHRRVRTYRRTFKDFLRHRIKDAFPMSSYPSPEVVQHITSSSSTSGSAWVHVGDARKWLDLAKRISDEQGRRFDEVDEWLGLLNGRSVEETRSARKLDLLKSAAASVHSKQEHTPKARSEGGRRSHPSASKLGKLSSSSTRNKAIKMPSFSAAVQARNGADNGIDDSANMDAIPTLASAPTSSSNRTYSSVTELNTDAERDGRNDTLTSDIEFDDEASDDDDFDPFGRSKPERTSKKRKRADGSSRKMVTFASIDEAFDLSVSDDD